MVEQPKKNSKSEMSTDKEVKQFIERGGRPEAEKDFNEIIKRAAKPQKKKQ